MEKIGKYTDELNIELTSQGVKIEKLETQLQQKENIIKEVREYLRQKSMIVHIEKTNDFAVDVYLKEEDYNKLLQILDKEKQNERLKELCNKYEEEHNTTFKMWEKDLKNFEHEKNRELKSRIDKAVEYINWNYNHYRLSKVFNDKILNILQGSDKE